MKKLITILFLFISHSIFAESFRCFLEKKDRKTELKVDLSKENVGKNTQLDDYELFVWRTANNLKIVVKKEKTPLIKATTQLKGEEVSFELLPDLKVTCLTESLFAKRKREAPVTASQKMTVSLRNALTFKYRDSSAMDQMRTLYFQSGKILSFEQIDKKVSWCGFTIQIKLDEDTHLVPPLHLETTRVEKIDGGVTSLNFVDFASGKEASVSSRFSPFTIQCALKESSDLTTEIFYKIAGPYLQLTIN